MSATVDRAGSRPAGRQSKTSGGKSRVGEWVAPVARAGYAAKAVVYGMIGALAVKQAVAGGDTTGSSGALHRIASGPFGTVLVGLLAGGLAAYVVWRLVQALVDPEHDEGGPRALAMRGFYLLSGILYALLAWEAFELLMGSGGGGGGGGGGGSTRHWTTRLMAEPFGRWLVGAIGVGVVGRGVAQFVKAYTKSFADKIDSFDLGPTKRSWAMAASRIGLSARGVIFGLIGGFLVYAAVTRDPGRARGLEGALETLGGSLWLLTAIGAGLLCYAVYQLVKARYRLIGV